MFPIIMATSLSTAISSQTNLYSWISQSAVPTPVRVSSSWHSICSQSQFQYNFLFLFSFFSFLCSFIPKPFQGREVTYLVLASERHSWIWIHGCLSVDVPCHFWQKSFPQAHLWEERESLNGVCLGCSHLKICLSSPLELAELSAWL